MWNLKSATTKDSRLADWLKRASTRNTELKFQWFLPCREHAILVDYICLLVHFLHAVQKSVVRESLDDHCALQNLLKVHLDVSQQVT